MILLTLVKFGKTPSNDFRDVAREPTNLDGSAWAYKLNGKSYWLGSRASADF